jgi:hypothetical protein
MVAMVQHKRVNIRLRGHGRGVHAALQFDPPCAGHAERLAREVGAWAKSPSRHSLVKHRRSSGRQNMVDQGVIVRPERVYDR